MKNTVVVKIGGSILDNPRSYVRTATMLKKCFVDRGFSVIAVVSAMKGVTDCLLKAYAGSYKLLSSVLENYVEAARYVSGSVFEKRVLDEFKKLEIVFKPFITRDPVIKDYVLSFGERISRILFTEALSCIGVRVVGLNALDIIKTNGVHGNASIDYIGTRKRLYSIIPQFVNDRVSCVIEGFIGSSDHGVVATLGRGGSDYTATTIAALLGIKHVYLVTNVPGILTSDPSIVSSTKIVPVMSYIEAYEASLYGGKKLHPRTFHPLTKFYNSVVHIGSFNSFGTSIVGRLDQRYYGRPKLVTYKYGYNGLVYVALIGEGVYERGVFDKVIDYIVDSRLDYEGLYVFRNRPSIVFIVKRNSFVKALDTLHKLVLELNGYEV